MEDMHWYPALAHHYYLYTDWRTLKENNASTNYWGEGNKSHAWLDHCWFTHHTYTSHMPLLCVKRKKETDMTLIDYSQYYSEYIDKGHIYPDASALSTKTDSCPYINWTDTLLRPEISSKSANQWAPNTLYTPCTVPGTQVLSTIYTMYMTGP